MRTPILTYHAVNVAGTEYAGNDHVALAADLRLIDELGLRIVPLHWLVEQHVGVAERDLSNTVALSCDDGTDLDFYDLDLGGHGVQRSFYNVMRDFIAERGEPAQPDLHLTCFVIASAQAREQMDRNCLESRSWMNESWWGAAQATGRVAIENHSWDHNHAEVRLPGIDGMTRGSFLEVTNVARADAEIIDAARYIDERIAPARTTLFCYPFGHVPEYLRSDYLPNRIEQHGMQAAFGDGAEPMTMSSDRWNLPRYICGWHWHSPDELRAILESLDPS